ncbi:MAG: CobD/CbiB family cobalamin biosynthesis protein [Cyanobium sp.]
MAWSLVAAACLLDWLLGDPRGWLHPVQVMGGAIRALRNRAESWAGDRPWALRLAGAGITGAVVGLSGLVGWGVERLALAVPWLGMPLLLIGLASALAGRSLEQAVREVLRALPDAPDPVAASLEAPAAMAALLAAEGKAGDDPGELRSPLAHARQRLSWIVGRDVEQLDAPQILRALAETASENGVDGLFAPLFWMLVGAALWCVGLPLVHGPLVPGPLALAWMFKAASTLDSMLGYRRGRLRWLGTAGARLDDALTWLPCRLVALSLPLVGKARMGGGGDASTGQRCGCWSRFRRALREGAADPSPNAGVSQAAYALVAGVRLGGLNRYGGEIRVKPLLAQEFPPADHAAVQRILALSRRLEMLWLLAAWALLSGLELLAGLGLAQ